MLSLNILKFFSYVNWGPIFDFKNEKKGFKRTIKKAEVKNRIFIGSLIVLEAKDLALSNKSGN